MPNNINRSGAGASPMDAASSIDRDPRDWIKEADVVFLHQIREHGNALH